MAAFGSLLGGLGGGPAGSAHVAILALSVGLTRVPLDAIH